MLLVTGLTVVIVGVAVTVKHVVLIFPILHVVSHVLMLVGRRDFVAGCDTRCGNYANCGDYGDGGVES